MPKKNSKKTLSKEKKIDDFDDILDDIFGNKDDNFGCDVEKLQDRGVYHVRGTINDDSVYPIINNLLVKNGDPKWARETVQIFINSQGGNVTSTFALIDIMNLVKMDICTIATGEASSGGSMILLAGTKGKRFITPNTEIMTHNFLAGLPFERWGTQKGNIEGYGKLEKKIINFFKKYSKYTDEEVIKKIFLPDGKEAFFTAEEAVAHGLADKVIE